MKSSNFYKTTISTESTSNTDSCIPLSSENRKLFDNADLDLLWNAISKLLVMDSSTDAIPAAVTRNIPPATVAILEETICTASSTTDYTLAAVTTNSHYLDQDKEDDRKEAAI